MEPKPWYQSKTIIFNVLTVVSAGLAAVVSGDMLTADQMKWIVVAQSMINIGLRLVTEKKITITN